MKRSKGYIVICLAIAMPFATLVMLSLAQQWFFPKLLPVRLTMDNWKLLLTGHNDLLSGLALSLFISGVVAVIATLPGFICARAIAFHPRREFWTRLLYLPFALASVIYGVLLQPAFIRIGISGQVSGVMLGELLIVFPYALIYFQSFWTQEIRQYESLAATLGATPRQLLEKVTLPLGRSALWVCFFQAFLISWFDFGLTNLIGVGKVKTLTVGVYQYIAEANIYYAALAGTLLVLPPVLLLWVNKRIVFQKVI